MGVCYHRALVRGAQGAAFNTNTCLDMKYMDRTCLYAFSGLLTQRSLLSELRRSRCGSASWAAAVAPLKTQQAIASRAQLSCVWSTGQQDGYPRLLPAEGSTGRSLQRCLQTSSLHHWQWAAVHAGAGGPPDGGRAEHLHRPQHVHRRALLGAQMAISDSLRQQTAV